MDLENTSFTMQENPFFEFATLLDNACMRLQSKQAQYSIRRLQKLNEILIDVERELDVFVSLANH